MKLSKNYPAKNRQLLDNLDKGTVLIEREFKEFIRDSMYPCLGAKSAINNKAYRIGCYNKLGTKASAITMGSDLLSFAKNLDKIDNHYATFAAIFQSPIEMSEEKFEQLLWKQLSMLHSIDQYPWDPSVSNDPKDNHFAFSFGGVAFYVIGLHPNSSRYARRFAYPTIVFNAHSQFDKLRQKGQFYKMQKSIRQRDLALQGSNNPMLADFGTASEAKQYSGREVSSDWQCPFISKIN